MIYLSSLSQRESELIIVVVRYVLLVLGFWSEGS
jgi:hypothetical protein